MLFSIIGWNINAQSEYNVIQTTKDGTPSFITFNNGSTVTHENFLEKFKKEFNIRKEDGLNLIKITKDKLGYTQFKYNQTYKGIVVYGAQYLIQEKEGVATKANGKFISNINIDATPTISKDDAIKSAMKKIGFDKYRWQDKRWEDALKKKTKNENASYYPKPELAFAPTNGDYSNGKLCLCWKFNIAGLSLDKAWTVFVDAKTGEIVNKISMVTNDTPATATTYYNGTQSIKCFDDTGGSGYYLLAETQRGTAMAQQIYTLTANNDSLPPTGTVFATSQYIGSLTTSFTNDPVANNVHWGIENAYDFYQLFSRNSFDDQGTYIMNLVHYKVNYNNAFWSNYDTVMCYGDGDGVQLNYVVGLDVEGHEFSHAITAYTAALDYQFESGALNESFSDILGTGIEWYVLGAGSNWTIGENVDLQAPGYLRSMSNPPSAGQPDTYGALTNYWVDQVGCVPDGNEASATYNDLCGVHTNSGVQNYWFYLLANGGSGTNDNGYNYSVTGIGMSDALNIVYRNLTVYLFNTSDYSDARLGSIQSATDFWGAGSPQVQSTIAAWCAVGVGTCSTVGIPSADNNNNNVTIAPNPFNSSTVISFGAEQKNTNIKITDVLGKEIKSINYTGKQLTLAKEEMSNGIYFVQITDENKNVINRKVVVQ